MGLEVELRKSGALKGVVATMRTLFSSNRVTLAVMPAFLGLLPSLGGARFSCPIVEEASRGILISPEEKSAVNLWFRHIFEFSNPLVPGMILACAITGVSLGTLITHIGWLTILSFVLGWIILIRPLKIVDKKLACGTNFCCICSRRSLPLLRSFSYRSRSCRIYTYSLFGKAACTDSGYFYGKSG
jgi:hypothetical protein